MVMIAKDIKIFYNKNDYYHQDYWDIKQLLKNRILLEKSLYKSKYYKIDFSILNDRNIKHELKLIILFCILGKNLKLISLRENYLSILPIFISFISKKTMINSIMECNLSINNEFLKYASQFRGKTIILSKYIKRLKTIYHEEFLANDYFDKDIWNINDFNISRHRINPILSNYKFNFSSISNKKNKFVLKKYIEHFILDTDNSFSHIYMKYICIKNFINFINKSIDFCEKEDIIKYISFFHRKALRNNSFNIKIYVLKDFFDFLMKINIIKKPLLYFDIYLKNFDGKFKYKSVSQFVIKQIFDKLEYLEAPFSIMYLLLYHTGMRISEICTIKVDSIYSYKEIKYIRYYQIKMKKEVENPIPEYLYLLLEKEKEKILSINKNAIYLFSLEKDKPISYNVFRKRLNNFMREMQIKNLDGSLYTFRAHAYRHAFALRLIENKVPFLLVQKLLHHSSPEMTLVYTQIDEDYKKKHYLEFYDIHGSKANILNDELKTINDNIIWMRHMINQVLPNGYCSLPIKLGVCPHANMCLLCKNFKTTREFLPILEQQLLKINKLEQFDDNLFLKNKRMLEIKHTLERIIKKLVNNNESKKRSL